MAARRPRQNPQPPNRTRTTRRQGVPSVAQVAKDEGLSYSRYDPGHSLDPAASPVVSPSRRAAPLTARTAREMDYQTALDIQDAKEGDDTALLPYQPTPSINPGRPRTVAAGYDSKTQTMRVRFREGVAYEYYDVPPQVWRNFRRVKSPGRFINRTLNHYPYAPVDY